MLKFLAVAEKTAKKTLGSYFFAAPCTCYTLEISDGQMKQFLDGIIISHSQTHTVNTQTQ